MQELQRSRTLSMTLERLQFADFRARVRESLHRTCQEPLLGPEATDAEILAALRRLLKLKNGK